MVAIILVVVVVVVVVAAVVVAAVVVQACHFVSHCSASHSIMRPFEHGVAQNFASVAQVQLRLVVVCLLVCRCDKQ